MEICVPDSHHFRSPFADPSNTAFTSYIRFCTLRKTAITLSSREASREILIVPFQVGDICNVDLLIRLW